MKVILCEKLPRILKNKKKLEKTLNVKIQNRGKEVKIEGKGEDEFIAEKVIDALNFGFSYSDAISIKSEDFDFEVISIKDYTKRKDLKSVRARIIGGGGKTLKVLSDLSRCSLELKENSVGIIGPPECIQNAIDGISSICHGSKQSNVYKLLEEHQIKEPVDLGLKK
ncbi:MAG: KH domain-containing protein [Candidatus Pacearchaeota archaeon]|jgi:KH domain-containing protein